MPLESSQAYIVRQPVHDAGRDLVAYEVMYVEGDTESDPDQKASEVHSARAIESLLTEFRDEGLLEGKDVLVSLTPGLLMREVPEIFDPNKLIIQIDEQVLLSDLAMKLVQKYRGMGYRVALQGFEYNGRYLAALDNVDVVKINYGDRATMRESVTAISRGLGKKIIAYNINSETSFEKAKADKADFFEGTYIGSVLPAEVKRVQHLQSNFFALMRAVTREEVDFDEIETLISRDVTLTYSLLRLVNSAYFALRRKTESVRQALVILGIGQLRQWIYLLSFQDATNMPSEFIKTSFLRANLCAELAPYASGLELAPGEAYLMGMFSTLGSLMDMPLDDALAALNLSDEVKAALLRRSGRAGLLYDLVLRYEEGSWVEMSNDAEQLGIPGSIIAQKYFECTQTVNDIWAGLLGSRS
ncbi:MAG: HDOD domain-containing protein [Clostridia bacterium]|nr:HDOD domain-containing protein [Clostridia bacterium]